MSTNYNINLTDSAIKKIHSLVEQERSPGSVLRIAISGGGCSGFKYNFLIDKIPSLSDEEDDDDYDDDDFEDDFDEEDDDEDYESRSNFGKKNQDMIINDNSGNPILMVDTCSVKFLQDSVIDYVEDLCNSGFQIKNNLAKSQCGCGNSFSV
ncbi:MAG: iron-sulfur cluster assembly accessory protein [Wolbachia endosymbiont of Tyrophagus putrescentiae]|nr:iron-sulfur cluster assembly accessory protein [Wolbachia endosymbiont of Tyrophagus putrescentiae]